MRSKPGARVRAALIAVAAAGLVAAVHCGGTGTSSVFAGGPCDTVFKGQCGLPCSTDDQCGTGLHCASGACNALCAPGETCENGVVCSSRGRCSAEGPAFDPDASVGDANVGDGSCADTAVTLTKVLPKVLFLLDQSSSMFLYSFPNGDSNNCASGCRWTVLKDVLIGPSATPGGLVKQLEAEAELGVELYSATDTDPNDGDNSFLVGGTDAVCPRFNGKAFDGLTLAQNNYAAIDTLLRPASVDDDTPTGPALRKVVGLLDDGGVDGTSGLAALPGTAPKVVVLVTDGEPGMCGDNFSSPQGRSAVVEAAQAAFKQKVKTFVIAIGDTTVQAADHFKAVANAGQGQDPTTGDAGAIQPSTPTELVDALKKIVQDARTCSFVLNGSVPAGQESRGTVILNGQPVNYAGAQGADGWRLSSPNTLELVGVACGMLKTAPDASLSASFPCGVVIPN